MKRKLRSVCVADFAKQSSSVEVAEITWELKLNQTLAEVTKLLGLILTVPATPSSDERIHSSLKRANNYMRNPKSEVQLVWISMNKELLKNTKRERERGADTFYNKVINELTKKKQRIELI